MARKIIIQDRVGEPSDFNFRYVLWADVPIARQPFYADAATTSAVRDVTASELTAIRDGAIIEKQNIATFVAGTGVAAIQAALISEWLRFQADVNTQNPWRFYGTFWDGSTWVVRSTV